MASTKPRPILNDPPDGTVLPEDDMFTPRDDRAVYDQANAYIHSTNKHDHSMQARLRYPPHWQPFIAEVVESVPMYRSVADLFRDALYHRLKYLSETYMFSEKFKRWLAAENRLGVVEQNRQLRELAKRQVVTMRMALDEAHTDRDLDSLFDLLEQAEEWTDQMPDPYRSQVMALYEDYMGRAKRMRT